MKMATLTLIALAMLAGSAFGGNFRVFYYVEKGDKVYGPDGVENYEKPRGRPFKYSAQAKTECAVYCELIENEPNAVEVTINRLED
jgi:hypothetical protein